MFFAYYQPVNVIFYDNEFNKSLLAREDDWNEIINKLSLITRRLLNKLEAIVQTIQSL